MTWMYERVCVGGKKQRNDKPWWLCTPLQPATLQSHDQYYTMIDERQRENVTEWVCEWDIYRYMYIMVPGIWACDNGSVIGEINISRSATRTAGGIYAEREIEISAVLSYMAWKRWDKPHSIFGWGVVCRVCPIRFVSLSFDSFSLWVCVCRGEEEAVAPVEVVVVMVVVVVTLAIFSFLLICPRHNNNMPSLTPLSTHQHNNMEALHLTYKQQHMQHWIEGNTSQKVWLGHTVFAFRVVLVFE